MLSRVKTGDVFQIRKNGPNYITLGKVRDRDGIEYISATKNGNIGLDGKMKRASLPTGDRPARKPKIHVIKGNDVKRIHSSRPIDLESVTSRNRRLASHLERTDGRNGIRVEAPNILSQIADLEAAL